MSNPFLALFVYLAVGISIIKFARHAYFRPIATLRRWFSYMPEREWASKLIRGFSVFWIFGGFLIIQNGVLGLPFVSRFKGIALIAVIVVIAGAGTALLLRRPIRESGERSQVNAASKFREK